ncbi:MAG: polymer-forming cytoskeletal protein [Chloroflexota bacterium]
MKTTRRTLLGLFLALLVIGFGTQTTEAAQFEGGETFTLEAGETINDDLYVTAGAVRIDGDVNGDLLVGGGEVTVNGDINGNVFIGAGDITINSNVSGDIFAAGGTLNLSGSADDVRVAFAQVYSESAINGDFMVASGETEMAGTVGGDMFAAAETLEFSESAKVGGKLSYTTPEPIADAQRVAASSEHFQEQTIETPSAGSLFSGWFTSTILAIVGYVAITWVILRYRPDWLPRPATVLNNKMGDSVIWGIVMVFLIPVASVILSILMGLFFGFGTAFATGFGLMSIFGLVSFITPIVIGYWVGGKLTDSGTTGILITVAAVTLLFSVPFIGGLFGLISLILVLGTITVIGRNNQEPPAEKVAAV